LALALTRIPFAV